MGKSTKHMSKGNIKLKQAFIYPIIPLQIGMMGIHDFDLILI